MSSDSRSLLTTAIPFLGLSVHSVVSFRGVSPLKKLGYLLLENNHFSGQYLHQLSAHLHCACGREFYRTRASYLV